MGTLTDRLEDPQRRSAVVDACCDLVETEVASKRGLSGAAVKTGFKVVRKVKPTIVSEVVNGFLPQFAEALDPWYQKALPDGSDVGRAFAASLCDDEAAVGDALLAVTDARISRAGSGIQKAYRSLRGAALGHVRAAVPGLASALQPFVGDA